MIEGGMTASRAPNRFDALRLVFAGVVSVYHLVALAELDGTGHIERALALGAELSIQGFFIISGALVYGSYTASRGVRDYAEKRVRRLYPAYATVVISCAVLGLFAGTTLPEFGRYLGANLLFANFLAPELPPLFQDHRFSAVNGALWTIKVEAMFYLFVPVIAWVLTCLRGRLRWLALFALYFFGEAWRAALPASDLPYAAQIARQLPGQLAFFAAGIALRLAAESFGPQKLTRIAAPGIALFAISFVPGFEPLRAAGLAATVTVLAYVGRPRDPAARFGDLSYGLYLVHFPIIQGVIAIGLFAVSTALGVAISAALSLAASLALWHGVEKRTLRRSSHYRRAETTQQTAEESRHGLRDDYP